MLDEQQESLAHRTPSTASSSTSASTSTSPHSSLRDKEGWYSFSLSSRRDPIVCGRLHNVYLRIERQTGFSGAPFYVLVLNGYLMDKHIVSGAVQPEELPDLRKLGNVLAYNIGINFFDVANISTLHTVRHPRPRNAHPIHYSLPTGL